MDIGDVGRFCQPIRWMLVSRIGVVVVVGLLVAVFFLNVFGFHDLVAALDRRFGEMLAVAQFPHEAYFLVLTLVPS